MDAWPSPFSGSRPRAKNAIVIVLTPVDDTDVANKHTHTS
jgi:hypothetical protein